jgi:hypothetical protein
VCDTGPGVRVMVFNDTFNNISVISRWSVLLVEEIGVPRENHQRAEVTDKLYHIMLYRVPNIVESGVNNHKTNSQNESSV